MRGAVCQCPLLADAENGAILTSFSVRCRQDAFTLDVLEVPQGSGSGFVWDKSGHIVTNFHVIRGASDLRLVGSDSGEPVTSILFQLGCVQVLVCQF
jgi:S1-C subfamily serine protease